MVFYFFVWGQNLKKRKGGCLYLAGSPGTGKSAIIHNLQELELKKCKKQVTFIIMTDFGKKSLLASGRDFFFAQPFL